MHRLRYQVNIRASFRNIVSHAKSLPWPVLPLVALRSMSNEDATAPTAAAAGPAANGRASAVPPRDDVPCQDCGPTVSAGNRAMGVLAILFGLGFIVMGADLATGGALAKLIGLPDDRD